MFGDGVESHSIIRWKSRRAMKDFPVRPLARIKYLSMETCAADPHPRVDKCQHALRAPKPPYPYLIVTIGDAFRKRRLEQGMTLNVAQQLNVNEATIRNWESQRTSISLAFWRRVHEFIGICPCDVSPPLLQRLRERREFFGITRKTLADMFDIDEHTVSAWEERGQPPSTSNMKE